MGKKIKKQSYNYELCKPEELTVGIIKENFKTGEIVTYKEMCNRLHLEHYTGGDQKKKQLKEIERYLELEKIKTKYLITDIYTEPKQLEARKPASNAIYVKYIECVLLQYLSSAPGNQTHITKSNLWKLLGITNYRYSKYKYNIDLLKKMYPVMTYFEINNFYQRSRSFINDLVERSLDSLDRRALIKYQKDVYIIVEHDRNGQEIHRRASVNEVEQILNVYRYVLLKYGLENKKQIMYLDLKKQQSFYEDMNNILFERFKWLRIYEAYHIIYNREIAIDALSHDKIELERLTLNEIVLKKINQQAQKKFDKNREDIIINYCDDKPLGFYYPDCYIEVQEEIANLLLRIEKQRKIDYKNEENLILQ